MVTTNENGETTIDDLIEKWEEQKCYCESDIDYAFSPTTVTVASKRKETIEEFLEDLKQLKEQDGKTN